MSHRTLPPASSALNAEDTVDAAAGQVSAGDRPRLRTIMIATFFGQVTEWYDYGIYAIMATQIGTHFFPSEDEGASLLAALAVFGVAFVARPLGGALIGSMGDRIGRKAVLVYSLALMTISTMAVGLLPGAGTLGVLAPALLVFARFLQGISAAGESTSAITYVSETVPRHRKGVFTATLLSGNSAGFLLALAVTWLLGECLGAQVFDAWGWRIGFLIALPLGLVGLYIRRHLAESPIFLKERNTGTLSKTPLRDMLTAGRGQLLQAIGLTALSMVANYLLVAYLPLHLKQIGFTPRDTSTIGMAGTLTLLVSYPVMGAISDRVGRRPMLFASCLFFLLLGWPLFGLLRPGSVPSALLCTMLYALGTSSFIACLGLYCTEYIDRSRMMTTYSTGFNVGAAIFGGSSLWVFEKLVRVTGDPRMPAAYLAVAAGISLVALLTIRPAGDPSDRRGAAGDIASSSGR